MRRSYASAAAQDSRARTVRRGVWLVTAGLALVALALPGTSVGGSPPGNNGTVKVDGAPFDVHNENEPHPGCAFDIRWYNFESNVVSDVTFEAQPPTGSATLLQDRVVLDADDASGADEAGIDAVRRYDLTGALGAYTPHPQQGYHVKLTIHTTGSQGADVKHKTFWVGPCLAPTPTPIATGTPAATSTATPTATPGATATPMATPRATVAPTASPTATPTPSAEVLGVKGTPPPGVAAMPPTTTEAAPAGGSALPIVLVGLGAMGLALCVLSPLPRRRR